MGIWVPRKSVHWGLCDTQRASVKGASLLVSLTQGKHLLGFFSCFFNRSVQKHDDPASEPCSSCSCPSCLSGWKRLCASILPCSPPVAPNGIQVLSGFEQAWTPRTKWRD